MQALFHSKDKYSRNIGIVSIITENQLSCSPRYETFWQRDQGTHLKQTEFKFAKDWFRVVRQ